MSMTHGNQGRGSEEQTPPRPPSSAHSSGSSGSGSKHVKCIGRYVLTGSTLGKGNFARVEAAVHTLTRSKVAIKIIETDQIKEDYVRKNLLREAQLMRRLKHPNIIRLYETMKTNNLYCLVTEVAEGGELLTHVRNDFKEKRLSEAAARPFIRQLVSALFHLHSVGVVHRDLKMENILLDKRKRNIKIVDFGLSNAQKPGALLQTHCGSPEYAAPELFIPGREYGPEVDVWSLGVNMYAMLVGKLPFRSPRQGSKRRQKLLEQISAGLADNHEKEMAHVSEIGRDLIARLLQPDPRRRVRLDHTMKHPWITKDGAQPLQPYRQPQPDPHTQHTIMQLMSLVLEVSHSDIKETVRRDRCDWLASIYNLLFDQPEGRNILQQLITGDPEDQLVDAATYQGSMEHLRLSQGASDDTLDQHPPEVVEALTAATANVQGTLRTRTSYRHQVTGVSGADYDTSTLPITRRERKRHHSQDPRPLAQTRAILGPLHPPASYRRRGSTPGPTPSPDHHIPVTLPDQMAEGRRLPPTPDEEPFVAPRPNPSRPHSRAESEPAPLPTPWMPKQTRRTHHHRVLSSESDPDEGVFAEGSPPRTPLGRAEETPTYKEPLLSPLANLIPRGKKRQPLNPIQRPRSVSLQQPHKLSGSVDANLHLKSNGTLPRMPGGGAGWERAQVAPLRPHSNMRRTTYSGAPASLGWPSDAQISTLSRNPKDIDSLMRERSKVSGPYTSIQSLRQESHHQINVGSTSASGSATSIEPRADLFSSPEGSLIHHHGGPMAGNSSKLMIRSTDSCQVAPTAHRVDPISGMDLSQKTQYKGQRRSGSAGAANRTRSVPMDQTASANHMLDLESSSGRYHPDRSSVVYTSHAHYSGPSHARSQEHDHAAGYIEHGMKGRPVSERGRHNPGFLSSLRGPFRKAS